MARGGRIVARHGERTALAEKVWSSERLDLAVLRPRGARPDARTTAGG